MKRRKQTRRINRQKVLQVMKERGRFILQENSEEHRPLRVLLNDICRSDDTIKVEKRHGEIIYTKPEQEIKSE